MMPMNSIAARASACETVGNQGRPCPVPCLFLSWFTAQASSYIARSIRFG